MEFNKDTIIEMIKSRGEPEKAEQAQTELPDKVDTEAHQGLLEKFGIDPKSLPGGLGELGSKFGL